LQIHQRRRSSLIPQNQFLAQAKIQAFELRHRVITFSKSQYPIRNSFVATIFEGKKLCQIALQAYLKF
jgi:hypothetical protein